MSPKSFKSALSDALNDPSIMKTKQIRSFLGMFDLREGVVAGAYGNKNSDTNAYLNSGISSNQIYIINDDSILRRVDNGLATSYTRQANEVDSLYPPLTN